MRGTLFALAVGALGAYVRLSDAGLSCPDWPGCYGRIAAPATQHDVALATQAFPLHPVEIAKARIELTHRYLVGGLGVATRCSFSLRGAHARGTGRGPCQRCCCWS